MELDYDQECFPTNTDLATFLGQAIADTDRADMLIDFAFAQVQGYCGQQIILVADASETILGDDREYLLLGEIPVVSVSELKINGDVVDNTGEDEWRLDAAAGILHRLPAPAVWQAGDVIEVTYDHGYICIPDGIRAATLGLAGRMLLSGVSSGAISQETIGNYSVSYGSQGTSASTVFEPSELRMLDPFRVRGVA